MTLWDLPKDAKAQVTGINDALLANLRLRLNEMGFVQGEVLRCMKRSPFNGPLVVQVQDCVYTVDKQLAQHIDVSNQASV